MLGVSLILQFFMSTQQVSLTAEEKDTLLAEGLPVPTTLPLTKVGVMKGWWYVTAAYCMVLNRLKREL